MGRAPVKSGWLLPAAPVIIDNMFEEPKLHLITFAGPSEQARTERERERSETRSRYHARVVAALAEVDAPREHRSEWADLILDRLFVHGRGDVVPCHCSCHPHLPESDFHDYGSGCPCQQTPEERRASWVEWQAERDAYWLELDLRPTGQLSKVWRGGPLDDDDSFELIDIEHGDVIAEGTIRHAGYGVRPVERAELIVGIIREHLSRRRCEAHRSERDDLECLFGRPLRWCPDCGQRL